MGGGLVSHTKTFKASFSLSPVQMISTGNVIRKYGSKELKHMQRC